MLYTKYKTYLFPQVAFAITARATIPAISVIIPMHIASTVKENKLMKCH